MHGVVPRSELSGDDGRAETLVNYKVCEPGDIVLNRMSAYNGALGVARQRGLVSPDYLVMEPREGVNADFVVAWLKTPRGVYEMTSRLRGIGSADAAQVRTPRINESDLRLIPVEVPSPEEQRAIADYLDRETARIDTLISEQQRLIELLRERRNAVLSAAFSPGPSTDTTRVGRLLSARPSYGVLVPKYVDETEGVPFVRVGDILNLATERPLLAIAPEQSDEYSRTKISGGEVLLGVVGKMGQAAVAPRWLAGANVARAVAVLRCKDAAVAPLLCAWLGSNDFLRQAELATSGDSIQPTLGMKDLARFDINLPTDPHAAADLAGQMAKIDTLIAETERFIKLVGERRSALITAAVTGQIDVRQGA
jgi:type I restriction enzyme S subunit